MCFWFIMSRGWRPDSSKTFAQLLLPYAYLLTVALICVVYKFTKITVPVSTVLMWVSR